MPIFKKIPNDHFITMHIKRVWGILAITLVFVLGLGTIVGLFVGIFKQKGAEREQIYSKLKDDPSIELNMSQLVGSWEIDGGKKIKKLMIASDSNGGYNYLFLDNLGLQAIDKGKISVFDSTSLQIFNSAVYDYDVYREGVLRFISEESNINNDVKFVFYYNEEKINCFSTEKKSFSDLLEGCSFVRIID